MGRNSVSDVSGSNEHGFKKNYGTAYDDEADVSFLIPRICKKLQICDWNFNKENIKLKTKKKLMFFIRTIFLFLQTI